MLINSIPRSCNAALQEVTASLSNATEPVESGDICTSYCITPLKQAALECQAIDHLYSAIRSLCCWNDDNQRWATQLLLLFTRDYNYYVGVSLKVDMQQ